MKLSIYNNSPENILWKSQKTRDSHSVGYAGERGGDRALPFSIYDVK